MSELWSVVTVFIVVLGGIAVFCLKYGVPLFHFINTIRYNLPVVDMEVLKCQSKVVPHVIHFKLDEEESRKWLVASVWLGKPCRRRHYLADPPESFKLALNPFLGRKEYTVVKGDEDVNWRRKIEFKAPVKEGFVLVHPDVPEVVSICMKVCLASSPKARRKVCRLLPIKD